MPMSHVHLTGASGSGTTTLGRALAARLGWRHLDTDDFYWARTDPPFQEPRVIPERTRLLDDATAAAGCVLSGSMVGWGDVLAPRFDLVLFLALPAEVRLERLRARERAR